MKSVYQSRVSDRSRLKFYLGIIPRFKNHVLNNYFVWLAKKNGATIGKSVTLSYSLAKKANSNLHIGNHSLIQTDLIDLRASVHIGNNVVIGLGVEILTNSHDIDSTNFNLKSYGIVIEDYCWLATRVFVLPSCIKIGYGAVCAAGSVIHKNVKSLDVVTGNPFQVLKQRKTVHSDLCVESLLGNDFKAYIKAYTEKSK